MGKAASESWDPRTWVLDWTPAAAATPRGLGFATTGDRRMPLALAAAAAVLVVGGVAAHLSRPDASPVAGAPATAAATGVGQSPPGGAERIKRTLVLPGAAELGATLLASGVPAAAVQAATAAALPELKPQGEIRAVLTLAVVDGVIRLDRLEASNSDSSGVVVTPAANGGFTASRVAAQLSMRIIVRRGTMDADSFYSSAVAAGVTDSVIPDFAKALAFDFDFQREVGVGDAFEAAFSQPINASGEAVGAPTLLYASLSTPAKSATVYRFAPDGGAAEWFDGSGRSIVRSLMRTPVDGARVSSKFGFRVHPVLGFMKLHKGTDFAAPTGTPIYASGTSTVLWAAMKGANGNLVILKHDNGWQTFYLHMSRFGDGIAPGVRVAQGQKIGEIGTTGRSTGPHLHYEVHVGGQPVDSMTIKTDAGRTLAGAQLIAFGKERDRIDISRAGQAN